MIDFKNGNVIKLKKTNSFYNEKIIAPLLVTGEEFIGEYQAIRDFVVFTNKRAIAVNVQGITGKKKDYTTLPYSKIQLFSIETSGVLDMDSELILHFSSIGEIRFEFTGRSDIVLIGKAIGEYML